MIDIAIFEADAQQVEVRLGMNLLAVGYGAKRIENAGVTPKKALILSPADPCFRQNVW